MAILKFKSFVMLGERGENESTNPVADSLGTTEDEQLHQVKRMIRGIGNMFVSVQCSECQSGSKTSAG